MNTFSARDLGSAIARMQIVSSSTSHAMAFSGGDAPLTDQVQKWIDGAFPDLEQLARALGLGDSARQIRLVKPFLTGEAPAHMRNVSVIATQIDRVIHTVMSELEDRKFLFVHAQKANLVDAPSLFGPQVDAAFPSAAGDIREAGNCIASECDTAGVFHLMRVAERGLRALAYDRRIKVPKGRPMDLATWEDLIKELEKSENAIRQMKTCEAREQQYVFYHEAMMDVRRFKNAFRNRVMHTRDFYDSAETHAIFGHVRSFMVGLSRHIGEGRRTPIRWTSKYLASSAS